MAYQTFEDSNFLSGIGGNSPVPSTGSNLDGGCCFGAHEGGMWTGRVTFSSPSIRLWKGSTLKVNEPFQTGGGVIHTPTKITYYNGAVWWPRIEYTAGGAVRIQLRKYDLLTEEFSTPSTQGLTSGLQTNVNPNVAMDLLYYPPDNQFWLSCYAKGTIASVGGYRRIRSIYCHNADGTLHHRAHTTGSMDSSTDFIPSYCKVSADSSYAYMGYHAQVGDIFYPWSRLSKTTTDGSLTTVFNGTSAGNGGIWLSLPYGLHIRGTDYITLRSGTESTTWDLAGYCDPILPNGTNSGIYLIGKIDANNNFYIITHRNLAAVCSLLKLGVTGSVTCLDQVSGVDLYGHSIPSGFEYAIPGQCSDNDVGELPIDPMGILGLSRVYSFTFPIKDVT